ncbi:MAG: hypothetical protein FWD19_00050, partial [Defluviitaleaceae bacterium]|nr:hypothetical protein [Defluviitaleaceae bacterium]
MINFLPFGIVDEIGKMLLDALRSVLEGIFGKAVKPLFDNLAENIVAFLLEALWAMIIQTVNMLLYNLLIGLLFVLDMFAYAFDIFAGMQPIIVDTATGKPDVMFNIFFSHSGISRAFWGITAIALILCVFFTIFAILRSMTDLEVKRPVEKILGQMAKSMLTFLLVPFVCIAGLNLSSVVLNASTRMISGQSTNRKVSVGTLIFTAVAQDAMRDHAITPAEEAVEVVRKMLSKTPTLWIIDTLVFTATKSLNESFSEDGIGIWNSSPGMKEFERLLRNRGIAVDSDTGKKEMHIYITNLFNSGGIHNDNNSNSNFTCVIADITEALGFGRMPYLDTAYVSQYIKPHLVHTLIGIICVVAVAVFMLMGAFIFARRIFEILLLYITSPYFVAMMPLDDGQKFKAWRDQFIGKMLAGFGIVLGMRIFLLMVPVIFSTNIRFTVLPITDSLIRMILLIAAVASVIKAHTLLSKIIGGE